MKETQVFDTYQQKVKSYKTMLWIGMVSMFMMFAGLTSAYIVSKSRPDWLVDFELPSAFWFSTLVIVLSSFTFSQSVRAVKRDNRKKATLFLWFTLVLGFSFVVFQFFGFDQVINSGFYFTGAHSNVTTSFLYIVVILHLLHLSAGLISLFIVIYNHFKRKYNSENYLGIELSTTFWHFLDFVWLYLFLFFSFFK